MVYGAGFLSVCMMMMSQGGEYVRLFVPLSKSVLEKVFVTCFQWYDYHLMLDLSCNYVTHSS